MDGLPQLTSTVAEDTLEWGSAVQITIRNTGEGPFPAPVSLEIQNQDGQAVRALDDITRGEGLAPSDQITYAWSGLDEAGDPVLWGEYTILVADGEIRETVTVLQPDNYALTVDPIPEEVRTGSTMTFAVNNTGTVWLNGTLNVVAGKSYDDEDRDDVELYSNSIENVQLRPEGTYEVTWNGYNPDGEEPEPDTYLVGAMMELDQDGPTPYAQDVFELTQR